MVPTLVKAVGKYVKQLVLLCVFLSLCSLCLFTFLPGRTGLTGLAFAQIIDGAASTVIFVVGYVWVNEFSLPTQRTYW